MKRDKGKDKNKNLKETRTFLILITLGILGLSLVLNYAIIESEAYYSGLAKIVFLATIICAISNIILGMFNRVVVQVTYIGGTLIGNMTVLSLYILSMEKLYLESELANILVISNFFIVELLLFIRRIILRDSKYINSVKQGKHSRYVKNDIVTVLLTSFLIILSAKIIDSNNSKLILDSYDSYVISIGGLSISSIGIAVYVNSIANYLFAVKQNIIK
jgi:hypothetical protein